MASENQQGGITPKDALKASVALAALLVTLGTVLLLFGKDIKALVDLAQLFVLPLLTGLGMLLYRRLGDVEKQVNGRMTQLIDNNHNSIPIRKGDDGNELPSTVSPPVG